MYKVRQFFSRTFVFIAMSRLFQKIIDFILYTSIFAACCAVGLSMSTEHLISGVPPELFTPLHLLVFSSTLLVYNVHYLFKTSSSAISDRFAWSQHHKLWHYLLLAVGLIGCVISVFLVSYKILLGCGVLALLSFAYSLPLLPFKNKKRIKDFGWVKIAVLTSVWTIVTAALPILYHDLNILDYPYEILMRFVFMFTLCVAFDIRDMQTDMESGIATLPNLIGVKASYGVMSVSMILFLIMSVIQYYRFPVTERLVGEVVVAIATKLVIDYSRKYPSDKAYLGLVDGMMLLYAVLLY